MRVTDRNTNTARYVHANYRFVVDPRRDYHAQSVDADTYLDWNSVLQILASPQSQDSACPICLGEPIAPRMARCGHIFCLPCLIRYMHSTDDGSHLPDKRARWKRCPICEDTVYTSETRPVRWYVGQEGPPPTEHDDIVLRLVMRPAGSTLALPRETHSMAKDEEIPWFHAADVMDFARVMKGSEDYMVAQHDAEIAQVEQLEKHDELMFGDDTEWTKRAVRSIREAKEKLHGIGNPPEQPNKPEDSKARKRPAGSGPISTDAPEMYRMQQAAVSAHDQPRPEISSSQPNGVASSSSIPPNSPSAMAASIAQMNSTHHQPATSDYYFYHALLHYYLSPLDIRILKAAFGDFSMFPSTILPRVERVSTGHVVDDELRKRTKYLAHLPRGCEVAFLECDWTDTVPAEVLEKFKPEIERRKKRNEEKEAKEEKERARVEKIEENKSYAAARRRRPSPAVQRFKAEDFEPLSTPHIPEGAEVSESFGQESTSPIFRQGSGFASLGSPGTSPNASRTVWGTAAIANTSPTITAQDIGPPADDGWLQGWERELLDEDQLVEQLESASLASTAPSQGGGKKKKGKKITLMSTNARRGA